MKRIIVLSDNHAGHLLGLTPPEWWRQSGDVRVFQETFWRWFCDALDPSGYDIMLHAGDLVEGEGKHDTSFHLTTDINEQVRIAVAVCEQVKATRHIFVSGTSYHGGSIMDYEKAVADHFYDGGFSWMRKLDIEGVKINLAHTVGKTTTPVGGDIMLRKQAIWNQLHTAADGVEPADLILRGHIHEARGIEQEGRLVLSCPALKLGNPDYDRYARKMQGGFYTVGFRELWIEDGEIVRSRLKKAEFNAGGKEYEPI